MVEQTVYAMFRETALLHGAQAAIGFKTTNREAHTYWTYADVDARVRSLAAGLLGMGLRKGDRLAILSENRPEWAVTDLAAHALGLIVVAPYASLPDSQLAPILADCGARFVVCSTQKQFAKVAAVRGGLPALEHVIVMDEGAAADTGATSLNEVIAGAKSADGMDDELSHAMALVSPKDIATIIYTSGTTGEPRGAAHSHASILHAPNAVVDEPVVQVGPGDVFLSFLPLSHITERVGGYYLPLRAGACIVYSQGLSALHDEITRTVRPTVMLCVPRFYESVHDRVKLEIAKLPERRRRIADGAIRAGQDMAQARSDGRRPGPVLTAKRALAERLVFRKLRQRITGGRVRYLVSGGAPLEPDTARFFLGIGLTMLEGYGLSEAGIIAVNRPGRQRIGTVGKVIRNVEMKIAPDGEIVIRSPGGMVGFFENPQATHAGVGADGWLATGDIGDVSQDGYLSITDRKKDIIVLSNGKNVAPQPIEALLKHSPYIAEAVLLGDGSPAVAAIVAPDFDRLREWAAGGELANADTEALLGARATQRLFKDEIDRLTGSLAEFERIRQFRLAPAPFSIEGGELTPTLKVKRRCVLSKYAGLVASMSR